MRLKIILPLILMLAACSGQRDKTYCDSFHLASGSADYAQCLSYFTKMEQWFARDAAECHSHAVTAFPDYMYDHARYAQTLGFDRYGYTRTRDMLVEPDYQRNQSLDNERRKIEQPCMLNRSWLSATDWQAGRGDGRKLPFRP